MMQGDSYSLGVKILNNAGSAISPDDVTDVEITIGRVSKSMSKGQLSYENHSWLYPVNQSESQSILPGIVPAQVRVVWKNGSVEGAKINGIRMHESLSKEVL